LVAYGVLSGVIMVDAALTRPGGPAALAPSWAVALTVAVFLGWGASLGVAAVGYAAATRPRPAQVPSGNPVA